MNRMYIQKDIKILPGKDNESSLSKYFEDGK